MAKARGRARGNTFGLTEALFGLVVGFLLSLLFASAYLAARGHHVSATSYGADIASLVGLWIGLVGAVVLATRTHARTRVAAGGVTGPPGADDAAAGTAVEPIQDGTGSLVKDYGIRIRPLIDVPVGAAVGVAAQFLLVPALESPLRPLVHNFNQRLGHPARQLLGSASGSSLVVLAILVCVGSPIVEELFFRGLVLRGLLGKLAPIGPRLAPLVSIVVTGIIFGLVHFEALQFVGLAGFGMILGLLAWWSGRLGPSIVAHMAFNATTVIAYAMTH